MKKEYKSRLETVLGKGKYYEVIFGDGLAVINKNKELFEYCNSPVKIMHKKLDTQTPSRVVECLVDVFGDDVQILAYAYDYTLLSKCESRGDYIFSEYNYKKYCISDMTCRYIVRVGKSIRKFPETSCGFNIDIV